MEPVSGARTFQTTGEAYDAFMGRYSRPLALLFADAAGVEPGMTALDVGCGPGALTGVLIHRLGAEAIPFGDACVDRALAQLVLHFVSDPSAATTEMRRVVRPGGLVAACVWDFEVEMEMLRAFWDAALAVDAEPAGCAGERAA